MSILVKNVSKFFGSQKALDNVSFEIPTGQIVGFLGPNGAGKSTLMKIITCYQDLSEGSIQVCGLDVKEDALEVRKKVGYLPEHNPLYLDMYVHEYLAFIGGLHNIKNVKERVKEVIELTGLTVEQNKYIGQLSKGYRQRVGLAQALIHNPKVLILDEPTTGLDPNQIVEIRKLIKKIAKEKTIIFSTHIMQEVQALCDRAIIINKGEIVADKKLKELREGKEQTVIVEFDYRVEDAFLLKLPKVKNVVNTYDFVYEITFKTSEDMRSHVFDFAHDNQLKILQLNQKNASLEGLFRDLTSK